MYVAPKGLAHKKPIPQGSLHHHLVLLVKNETGYRNLCQLISIAYLEGFYYRPRIDKQTLARHSEGLLALSACLKGEISELLTMGQDDRAEEAAREYMAIFPKGDFYIELQDHGLEPQKRINPRLIALAGKLGLPLVVTNDVHYLGRSDADSHDVLLCIQTNKKITDQDRIRFGTKEFYFKSEEEMRALFPDVPEAADNTLEIAEKCHFDLNPAEYFLPNFEPPGAVSLREYFTRTADDGFEERMRALAPRIERGELPSRDMYRERLEMEKRLVGEMGFEGYFLIVWDLIREARKRGIPVGPGRGSAAGSLLAFSMGITQIDPLEYDLLFERFLNPERISLPDIDIDFCGRRREEIIQYVTEKYGRENVCQIITFGTMAARQAVRDAGRALDVPLSEVDKVAKMIPPMGPDASIAAASRNVSQLRDLRASDPSISRLLTVAETLEGQVRHASIHAAGIVITPRPLTEFVPLYQSSKAEVTTQFPMQDVESIGLLKMDILGLRNLTVIQDTLELVARTSGEKPDIGRIPLDDAPTFELFQAGNTDGVFQFESSGMKDLLRRFKPEVFSDLIALNALYRPGPLQSGMTEDFIRCKNNPDLIRYEFPDLEPILKETKGMIVYQEQVMRIATNLAGFSMADADLLRKAMGKKKTEVMNAQKKRFMDGAKANGHGAAKAEKIWEQINYFAGYGFNKSHSAAYAYLAFQTAYLKAHFPECFLAALLTSEAERGATPQLVKYINECREMGITVLPPDINRSEFHFSVEDGRIRFGLSAVKNVGEGAIRMILDARDAKGDFRSPFDICREVNPRVFNRKVIESLIKAGALDSMGWKRAQMFEMIDDMIHFCHDFQKIKESGQTLLFGAGEIEPPPMPSAIRAMPEWEDDVLLAHEKDALGFYLTGHPLDQYGSELNGLISHTIEQIAGDNPPEREIKLAGIISGLRQLKTRKDERMATFVLEDTSGRIDVVSFPDSYRVDFEHIRDDLLVWARGILQSNGESRKFQAQQVLPLEQAMEKRARKLILRVDLTQTRASDLEDMRLLLSGSEGECPVYFELKTRNACRVLVQSTDIAGVHPTRDLTRALGDLLGENRVIVVF
jgi:DNA polymerase-3 subunit alpha